MLTYPCRIVLSNLKKLTKNTDCNISYLYDTTCFCLDDTKQTYNYYKYESEIESIISLLIEDGYLTYTYNKFNFQLTQKGIHKNQFTFAKIRAFILNNLISIIALIVAIIALFNDLGLISLPIIK